MSGRVNYDITGYDEPIRWRGRVPQLLPVHLLNRGSLLGLSDGNGRFLSYALAYNLLFTGKMFFQVIWLVLSLVIGATAVTYTVPSSAPSNAATLDPAPVGIS